MLLHLPREHTAAAGATRSPPRRHPARSPPPIIDLDQGKEMSEHRNSPHQRRPCVYFCDPYFCDPHRINQLTL